MGVTNDRVPVVDARDGDAPDRFAASLRDSGFALLAGHGVPTELIATATDEWDALFDAGVPARYVAGAGPWGYHRPDDGVMPDGTRRDRKDYYHLGLTQPVPPGVSGAARELLERAMTVAGQLLGWLDEAWPAGAFVDASRPVSCWLSRRQSVLRLQRYLPLDEPAAPGTIRALEHADINLITLLPAPEVTGLQIRPVGGDWLDLAHEPDLLIVNIGEMLQVASGGHYPATPHRVVVRDPLASTRSRWSLPMFFHPEDDVELAPGRTAGEFRAGRVAEYRRKGWLVSAGGGDRHEDGGAG